MSTGGDVAKLATNYEVLWTCLQLLELLDHTIVSLTPEPVEDGVGIEFCKNYPGGVIDRHSVIKAHEARQNLERGFHQLAVSNPALVEAVREIRATQPPEKQEQEIARLGRAFAISTKTRVQPIRSAEQSQSGPKVSV